MSIFSEAEALVSGQRREDYGAADSSFGLIAGMWSEYAGVALSSHDVAAMMILLKLARAKNCPSHRDSWVDVIGYAGLAGDVLTPAPKDGDGDASRSWGL